MKIVVLADQVSKEELMAKKTNGDVQINFIKEFPEVPDSTADAFILVKEGIEIKEHAFFGNKPVFISATTDTMKEFDLPENFSRISGWTGFLKRELWEIATRKEDIVKEVFEKLEWKYIRVADEPGLVSPRIISMIINEAYFALGENVSTKDEIDIAMKLGTNYPYGPFEWSQKIGLWKICDLLEKLSGAGGRYNVAPALKKDLGNN